MKKFLRLSHLFTILGVFFISSSNLQKDQYNFEVHSTICHMSEWQLHKSSQHKKDDHTCGGQLSTINRP